MPRPAAHSSVPPTAFGLLTELNAPHAVAGGTPRAGPAGPLLRGWHAALGRVVRAWRRLRRWFG